MEAEEPSKSTTGETLNPNLNPNPGAQDDVNDDELEEGEIVDDEESSAKKSSAVTYQPHPLEHQWTFWFDNPSAKSKQAAWGSSMRSIYTFATVEDFWSGRGKADTSWLYTLLAMIGEQFDHGDEICGAVVNVRKQEKIALWTKNASNEAAQLSIGKQWKEFLEYNDTIGFIFHEDAKKFDRSAKNRYTI
ncbi:hypothetical protein GH714_004373 [Hevea brasiliensis]|uniref:Eukaryotic translation initiation factor 4E-1 n=1 Tax=Hevea brasiliensis TaxID=3981 RepID=A0A6A6LV75_HEVBR|nr:hypothetical protein GH714_004373 [Hevea brasiliensis]